jgi:multidrug resistance efflux pump
MEMEKPVMTDLVRAGGVLQPVRMSGTAEAIKRAVIASELKGVVESLFVEEGDEVEAGTVLLTLRQTPIRLMYEAAKARLAAEEARLAELRAGTRPEDVTIARAELEDARIALGVAERDFERFSGLFQTRSVSESELDRSKEALESARARYAAAEARLQLAVEGPRSEEILAQIARVAAAQAEAGRTEDDFERSTIRAPFAGVITRRLANVGSWVSDGDPVFEMEQTDLLRVRVNLPEQEFNRIQVGKEARLTFDAWPQESQTASVTRVIPRADMLNRAFPILIDVPNPDRRLASGMLARVEFSREVDGSTVVMNKDAIVAQGPVPVVFKVEYREGKPHAKRLEVQTGRFFGPAVEVISAELKPGDQVVIRGNERLRDGDALALNTFVTVPAAYVADESKFFREQ